MVQRKHKIVIAFCIAIVHCGIESSENTVKIQENFALIPLEIQSKIFFHTLNKHDDKIKTLHSLFFVCKHWNDIIFNKRDEDQYVFKIHELVHEYLWQRIEDYKLSYDKENLSSCCSYQIYENKKNILFSPFVHWGTARSFNTFVSIILDYLELVFERKTGHVNISSYEFNIIVKKAPTITCESSKSKMQSFIKQIILYYCQRKNLAILLDLSSDINMYEFLKNNVGAMAAYKCIEELMRNIFRFLWQHDANVINKETIKVLGYYFKKIYGNIKSGSITQYLKKDGIKETGYYFDPLIYMYFVHSGMIQEAMVEAIKQNVSLREYIERAGILTKIFNTSKISSLITKIEKNNEKRINYDVIRFMKSIIYYRNYLKKIINDIPVKVFLECEDEVDMFNQLYSIDEVYAKQFFDTLFKKTSHTYYNGDAIEKWQGTTSLIDMFCRYTVFPCPLFLTDEKGKMIYDYLNNLEQDFKKQNPNEHININLGILRNYFSFITKKDFKESKDNLKNIKNDIVKVVEYMIYVLCGDGCIRCPIQELLCEYDQDFGTEILSLFLKQKYEREFSSEELQINPVRYRYPGPKSKKRGRIDIGLNFYDVKLLYDIIMNLGVQKKKKQAKQILRAWRKDQPQKINELLVLLVGNPDRVLSDARKQKEFDICFNFLQQSCLLFIFSFSLYRFIFWSVFQNCTRPEGVS